MNEKAKLTDEQIAKLPFELYREGFKYYGKTHAHPNSTFKRHDHETNRSSDFPVWRLSGTDFLLWHLWQPSCPRADDFSAAML